LSLTKENTIVIIGKSPILDDLKVLGQAREAIYKFHSIGINHASYLFNTEYFAYVDHGLKLYLDMVKATTKVITIEEQVTMKLPCEYFKTYVPKDTTEPIIKDGHIAYCGFTHDLCLGYAYLKGYENVLLYGVADFDTRHYTSRCQNLIDRPTNFNPSTKLKELSIKYINEVYSKHLNIYTANPNSILNVPRIETLDK